MIEIVDPRGEQLAPRRWLASRRGPAVNPRRIGFLCNEGEHLTGPHFPGYTRMLEDEFQQRFGPLDFHREIKPVLSRPAEPDMLAQFLEYDGVVNGLAK